jgi:release factor glutamine methyltransferase
LDGGADGLAAYRAIAAQADTVMTNGGWLLVEVGAGQAAAVQTLFAAAGLTDIFVSRDLAGIERVVGGRRLSGRN